jgi:hypothetical protein
MSKEYVKSVDDEIDWKIIDQLHSATVSFSSTSLELKKLYFVLVGIAVPSLIKLAGDKLDTSLFVSLYILSFTFWFLDSFTYFYQEKLREKMDKLFNQIKARHTETIIVPDSIKQDFTIEKERTDKNRFWRSVFNSSVRLYWILIILNSVTIILFLYKIIK